MKKNNKGFFLAETIVIVALVTTVMAFVYPNVSKLYTTYKNRTNYYNQPEDIYAVKALISYLEVVNNLNPSFNESANVYKYVTTGECNGTYEPGVNNFSDGNTYPEHMVLLYSKNNNVDTNLICKNADKIGGTTALCVSSLAVLSTQAKNVTSLEELYITGYMSVPSNNNYNFDRYLKMMKKITYDPGSYRLVGVFKEDDETRYASVKIDNPNPIRSCNLGGEES